MKNMAFICLSALLFSACNNSNQPQPETTDVPAFAEKPETDSIKIKLKEAIKAIVSADLKTGGYTIQYLLVDSLSYKAVSLQEYYQYRKASLDKAREEYRKLATRLSREGTPMNMEKYRDDSVRSDKADQTLMKLITRADTALTIYRTEYHLNARTNTTPYFTHYTKYLFIKDLTEVKMHFEK